MSQIFRIVRPEMIQICRIYGSHRNLHSHYETLRLSPNATQKDIRHAFVKLSKEMHPDTSKKSSHEDFVKVNEAYKVLSKEHTRRRYDMEMQNRGPNGRPIRVVYYDPDVRGWYPRPTVHPRGPNDPNFYSVKGVKRVSNVTVVLLCIILSAFGIVAQVVTISRSVVLRNKLLAESSKYAEEYKKVRMEAESKDHEQQIADLQEKLAASDADTGIGLHS